MRARAFCLSTGLVLAALAPAFPAAAATTTITLVSGGAAIGFADPETDVSTDGGLTYQDATVVRANPLYHTISGTGWISTAGGGGDRQHITTVFRRSFTLPATTTAGSVEVCLHSDNTTRVLLNGTLVGEQPYIEDVVNFRDPAECYTATGPLLPGENVLVFQVHNFRGPMGLDYRAVVTYDTNTPPVLVLPDDITVNATMPAGATVTFTATASDDGTAAPTVACEPASGSTFPVGTTTVTCTATDDEGAVVSGSFTITVRGAADQLSDLLAAVDDVGPGTSLADKIQAAIASLGAGDAESACGTLRAFSNQVHAQSGKKIPATTAAGLIEDATRIRSVLACG